MLLLSTLLYNRRGAVRIRPDSYPASRGEFKGGRVRTRQARPYTAMIVKLLQIFCIISFQQAYCQQQSTETCNALDAITADPNVGMCTRNTLCTMVSCGNANVAPVPITYAITLLPCEKPTAIRAISTASVFGPPITVINETITESTNVTITVLTMELGTAHLILTRTATGITFGLSLTTSGQLTALLPETDIPLQCGSQATSVSALLLLIATLGNFFILN